MNGLSWSKGINDFFEARVAAQWVPIGLQLQLTITHGARGLDSDSELLAREIFVAGPRGDHSQIFDHERTINCIFFYGQKLNRAATFAHCFLFASKSGVDQAKH